MKAAVITVSDRASRGEYDDLSGPAIEKILKDYFGDALDISRVVVPDEAGELAGALDKFRYFDFILTTGGTGIGPRDMTPEVCEEWCEKSVPGIAEALRSHSLKETPSAMLSRGYAGMKDKVIVINMPGSVKAVKSCTSYLLPVLEHAGRMIRGEGH